jgi:hypothetical protein
MSEATEYMDQDDGDETPYDKDDPNDANGLYVRPDGMRANLVSFRLKNEICQMHPKGRFTIINVPGLDQEGTRYLDYVKEEWKTFVCVIVVLDATTAHDTDRNDRLIDLVEDNIQNQRIVPVIYVINKMDLVGGTQALDAVARLTDKIEALNEEVHEDVYIDEKKSAGYNPNANTIAQIVYTSTAHALLDKMVRANRIDHLDHIDMRVIDKIGRDHLGPPAWDLLTTRAKYQQIASIIRQSYNNQSNVIDSGTSKFFGALSKAVGSIKRHYACCQLTKLR